MAQLSQTIVEILGKREQSDLADKADVSPSFISHLIRAKRGVVPSIPYLTRIIAALTPSRRRRAQLVQSFLLDLKSQLPGGEMIKVTIGDKAAPEPRGLAPIEPEVDEALRLIHKHIPRNTQVRNLVLGAAALIKDSK